MRVETEERDVEFQNLRSLVTRIRERQRTLDPYSLLAHDRADLREVIFEQAEYAGAKKQAGAKTKLEAMAASIAGTVPEEAEQVDETDGDAHKTSRPAMANT